MAVALPILVAYLVWTVWIHPGPVAPTCNVETDRRLTRWDGDWYWNIATIGYGRTYHGMSARAFFPLFPLLSVGVNAVTGGGVIPAGVTINVVATCAAMVFVDRLVASWEWWQRALLIALLVTLPFAVFYGLFYGEGLLALGVAMTLWGLAAPGRLPAAAAGVVIGSLARPTGLVLLLPLLIVLVRRGVPLWQRVATLGAALSGVTGLLVYFAVTAHDALAFEHARSAWAPGGAGLIELARAGRSVFVEDVRTILLLQPSRFQSANQNAVPLPTGLGFYLALLAAPLLVAAWRWWPLAAAFAVPAWALGLLTGGQISQGRYVLVLLPMWIGTVALARGRRWPWGMIAAVVVAGFGFNLYLGGLYSNCYWAG